MFKKLINMTGEIKYPLYGVKLNAQNFFFRTNTHTATFAPLVTCVIGDTLLKIMPDIDQALLQFIDVINLIDLLLYFSPSNL